MGARLADTRWSFLVASVSLNLIALWTRARRWRYLFPPGDSPTRLFNAVMIGYMGNNLLPLRAGEILRAWVVARRGPRMLTAVATIVVERVLDGLVIGILLAWLALILPIPREVRWAAVVFVAADLAMIGALGALAAAPDRARQFLLALLGRWTRIASRAESALDTFGEGLRGVRAPGHVVPLLVWSTANWVLWALAAWTGFLAARLDLPLTAAWAVLAFVGLGVSLPSSPGFVGVTQAATVLALALFGIPRDAALSFSLLLHAAQALPVTAWGLLAAVAEHVSLADVARGASRPAVPPP